MDSFTFLMVTSVNYNASITKKFVLFGYQQVLTFFGVDLNL